MGVSAENRKGELMNPEPLPATAGSPRRLFANSFRKPKQFFTVLLIGIAVVSSPIWYREFQSVRAANYVERINPQLLAHPVYHEIVSWKTLKGPYLLSFSGSVKSEAELSSFKEFIVTTHPPGPYSIGVFIDAREP